MNNTEILRNLIDIVKEHQGEFSSEDVQILKGINRIINERWITIKPHGDDSDDYRRLKLEDGESPKEAIDRVYKNDDKKEDKKEKSESAEKTLKERVEGLQNQLRKFDEEFEKINKEGDVHRYAITDIRESAYTMEEASKKIDEYEAKHRDELDSLDQRYNELSDKRNKINKDLNKLLSDETAQIMQADLEGLDDNKLKQLVDKAKELMTMPIAYYDKLNLREKVLKIHDKISSNEYKKNRQEVKEVAGVKIGKPMTFEEADTGKVNPKYKQNTSSLSYGKNCQSCVVGYNLRRRGFDVQTKGIPIDKKGNIIKEGKMYELAKEPKKAWIDPKTGLPPEPNICDSTTPDKAYNWLDKQIKDGIYSFRLVWKNSNSGHIVIAHRVNGNLQIYDPQTNKEYKDKDSIMHEFFNCCKLRTKSKEYKPYVFRTDTMDINKEYADAIMEKY